MAVVFHNPFENVICATYWQIYIPMFCTWFIFSFPWIFKSIFKQCENNKIQIKTLNETNTHEEDEYMCSELRLSVKESIRVIVMNKFLNHLNYITSVHDCMQPNQDTYGKISVVIMSFIPDTVNTVTTNIMRETIHNQTNNYEIDVNKVNKRDIILIHCTRTYFIMRFIFNIVCWVIIMIRYVEWYNKSENINLNNWHKYTAFCVGIILYHPSMKLNGFIAYSLNQNMDNNYLKCITWISDGIYLLIFCIISFPLIFTAIPVFLPTLITYISVTLICMTGFMMMSEKDGSYTYLFKYIYRQKAHFIFCSQIFVMLQLWIICIVPFCNEQKWFESYFFGFYGRYCPMKDRLSINNAYDTDIQVLIVSWFIF
eukprot:151151_1